MADLIEIRGLKEFEKRIQQFAKTLPESQVVPFQQKIALQVLSGVVLKTPVDMGRARAAWVTTINRGSDSIPQHSTAGDPKSEARKNASAAQAITAGTATIAGLRPFQAVFISNNVSYIEALENGHSDQAPAGMVAVTIEEVRSQFG